MNFEIVDLDALGRIGKLIVNRKEVITPCFFPVVHPIKNIISASSLKNIGAQCLFTNAYIMYQNETLREKVLKEGIHHHLDFDGLIATDSGAFQQYMYKNRIGINADTIEKFQEDICSDFPVILDIPVQLDDSYDKAKEKVIITINRAKDNIKRRTNENCHWFGPIHGGKFFDLLKTSAIEMSKLDFDIYAIGGLVKAFLKYKFYLAIQILLTVKKNIIPNKPIHMFGLGLPQFFSLAVACGCDLMDSAAYVLYARENRYFTLSTGTKNLKELEEFPCHCPVCSKYTPKEVKKFEEKLRIELVARHNLYLSFSELRTVRQAIREGNLWELVEQRIRNHPALVEAVKVVQKNKNFFESHEKIYKKHGRLYSSSESIHRPLLYRYAKKIIDNYRVPKDVKYLIILPELEEKGDYSYNIKNWLEYLNNNILIPRMEMHVVFYSEFYGIIPLELGMFQYESIKSFGTNDILFWNALKKVKLFFKTHISQYVKCGALIPEKIVNQNNEIIILYNNSMANVFSHLKSKFNYNLSIFNSIEDILQFFKDGNDI